MRASRRSFIQSTTAFAGFALFSSNAKAISPNGKLRTAHVGVGGMGNADLKSISSHSHVEVAALCDVDRDRLDSAGSRFPDAKRFRDYREMIDQLADKIDAVIVSTPDHTHAPAAMWAMNHNKPVYCQKPLTHQVFEARRLNEVAAEKKLVSQMGIQVHSSGQYRQAVKIIQAGTIGKVKQVHAWSAKNWGYDGKPFEGSHPVPESIDWNLWLGVAAERNFHPRVFHPGNWRKLVDFGTGTLGDMGVHIFDTPYAALELTHPKWARTDCRAPTGVGHPEKNVVQYEFPGTKYTTDSLIWTWYDGAFAPPKEPNVGLPKDLKLPGQGSLFVGEEGSLLLPHVATSQLFPRRKFADYQLPKVDGANHYHQFVDACMGKGTTSASFAYGGPLTEALLLGVVANRFPGTKLTWDPKSLRVTNVSEANLYIRKAYRTGFEVDGLS